MLRFAKLAVGIFICSAQALVLAADPDEAGNPKNDLSLDTITVVASLRERPLREVAGSITIIGAEQIAETLAADIKDISRYTPWLSVSNDPSRFGLAGFTIRGLGANRVATEIDGIPVANAFAVGNYSNSGRDAINPAIVRQAEILRGPASALYGSDALGGVISFTTLDPDDLLFGTDKRSHVAATAGYDGRDDALTSSITAAADLGPVSALLAVTGRYGHATDNRSTTAAGIPNPRDYDQTDLTGKLKRATDRGDITLTVDTRRTHAVTQVDDLEGRGRFASTVALQGNDRFDRNRISIGTRMQTDLALADDISWSIYHQHSNSDQRTTEDRVASAREPFPSRRSPRFRYRESVLGSALTAARDVRAGSLAHRFVYGLQLDQRKVTESRDNSLINLDTGDTTNVVLGESFPVRDFPISRITEAAVFIHDEISFGEQRLTLIPGMRAEYYALEPRIDSIYAADNPSSVAVSIHDSSLAPKLGAVMQLSDSLTLFAQYARGFRSPPFEDVNIGLEIPLFNVRAIPNPDLRPETSDGYELGVRMAGSYLRGSASLFENRYKNFIDSKVNLGPDPATGVLIFQSLNRARAEIRGIELELEADLDRLLSGLTLVSNFASSRGTDSVRDLPLNSVDPVRATLGFRYAHPAQRWGGELMTSLAAAKTRVDNSNVTLFQPPGYGIIDLFAYVHFTPKIRLNIGLFNLGNKRYWDWADVRGRPLDDPLIDLYTRPGFNAAASLRIDW